MTTDENALLIHYLTEEGCSWQEIERVLEKLSAHDERTMRESVFDSIAAGTFNLRAIIQQAKGEASLDAP